MKLNIHSTYQLSTQAQHYKMMALTAILAVIIMLFLSSKANPESYDNTVAISAKRSITHFTDISNELAENDISDKGILCSFLYTSVAMTDNGYPVLMSFHISDIGKKTRLNVLLDYESRAP